MDQIDEKFGKPNPSAAGVLSRFAFLIVRWRCEAKVRLANFRVYDTTNQIWNIKWMNALAGTWVDLGPGGARWSAVRWRIHRLPATLIRRATYTNISKTHFTWRGEKSDDGKAWSEFVIIEAYRGKE